MPADQVMRERGFDDRVPSLVSIGTAALLVEQVGDTRSRPQCADTGTFITFPQVQFTRPGATNRVTCDSDLVARPE